MNVPTRITAGRGIEKNSDAFLEVIDGFAKPNSSTEKMNDEAKIERLASLFNHHDIRVVSVRRGDGVLLYENGVGRLGGEPAIEIPHDDPHFSDATREYSSFTEMIRDFGCEAVSRGNCTYVVAREGGDAR